MPPSSPVSSWTSSRPRPWAVVAGYLTIFLLLDWASFIRPLQHLNITPWNPQPALAVALLLSHRRLWWVVWSGLLVAEALVRGSPGSLPIDLAIASALTCSYFLIAALVQAILKGEWRIASPGVVARLIGAIAAGALLSAVAYVGVFAVAGLVERPLSEALARYWVGEMVGMVVTLPIVLSAVDPQKRSQLVHTLSDGRWWMIAAIVGLLLIALWSAGPALGMDFSYLLLLPMVWAATQFGSPGALLTAGVTQVGLIFTVQAAHHQDLIVFELQLLMAGVTITGLLLGVVVDARQRADIELRRSLRLAAAGQMSAALAHELGQPLTAVASYAQACRMILERPRPANQEDLAQLSEVIGKISEHALRAGEIIHRLRDFFRHGSSQLRQSDLAPLLEGAVTAQERRAASMGVSLQRDWPRTLPKVLIDPVQTEVVLRNLMANAIDSSSSRATGGEVKLRAQRSKERVLVEFLDNGPGVSAGQALDIFDGVESEKPGGMGIGLSICRAIIEAHGGRLWVEPGSSGHFCLTLPVDKQFDEPSDA